LRLVRSHKLFLGIGYSLLVASIFCPFATDFHRFLVRVNPGPYTGPPRAGGSSFWSFMHIQQGFSKINGTWVVTGVQWLSFSACWNWWRPSHGRVLILTFSLQIITVLLGIVTLRKTRMAIHIVPLLFTTLGLNFLYFAGSQRFHSEVFIGFWLSLLSTASIIIATLALIRTQRRATAHANARARHILFSGMKRGGSRPMFDGGLTVLFWLGLLIFGVAITVLFWSIWFPFMSYTSHSWYTLLHWAGPFPITFGSLVFMLIGLYMMKSGAIKEESAKKLTQ
jgi:hypothetical protein